MADAEGNVLAVFGGEAGSIPRQGAGDADLILNFDLSRGELEPRLGWRVVRTPDTWEEVADDDLVDRWSPLTYKTLAWKHAEPLGAYLFHAPSGSEYVITLRRFRGPVFGGEPNVFCEVSTTAGDQVHPQTYAFPPSGVGTAAWLLDERPGRPYVFAEFGAFVYFTNGGKLWRWGESDTAIRDASAEVGGFYRNPNDDNQHIYLSEMKGASVLCEHNSRMVYAGFDGETWLGCDKVIDPDSDEVDATEDAEKEGIKLQAGGLSARFNEATVFVSDPNLPRCVRVTSIITIPNLRKVTGVASFRQLLVIWSASEMYIISTAGAIWQSRRYCGIGCAAQRSIVATSDGRLMWLAPGGVYSWDGSALPVRASAPVDVAFQGREGHMGLPRGWTIQYEDTQLPHIAQQGLLRFASAAEIVPPSLYCVALKAGTAAALNDVVLCVQYSTGMCWWWTSGSTYDSGTEDSPIDAVQAATEGLYTIMSSIREPEKLFAQAYHYPTLATVTNAALQPTHMCVAVLDNNDTDQKLTWNVDAPDLADQPFEALYVSQRFRLADSSSKIYRQVRLRMYATRDDTFLSRFAGGAADTNKIQLALLPELAPFEAVDQLNQPAATASQEYATTVNPWPQEYASPKAGYFWQPGAGAVTIGKWQADGGPAAASTHRWLPLQPFNKRVDLRCPSTQFCRLAIRKRVDAESGRSLRVLSISIVGAALPEEQR